MTAIEVHASATSASPGGQLKLRELAQCRLEIELASQLRNSTKAERAGLYSDVYAKYNSAFPEALASGHEQDSIAYEVNFVRKFAGKDSVVVEIGPGRCGLGLALAPHIRQMIGVDVASHLGDTRLPANFELLIFDGLKLPLSDNSVDVMISNDVLEHLHPDDAADQITEAFRVLRRGGVYLCTTPNRIAGPHDCSNILPDLPCEIRDHMYVANGLHLKEYTNRMLADLFLKNGFTRVTPYTGARGSYAPVSLPIMLAAEELIKHLPLQRRSRSRPLRALLGVRMRATK